MDEVTIIKYLSGNCSEKESQQVQQWLKDDSANKQYFDQVKRIWEVEPSDDFEPNIDKAWAKVEARIDQSANIEKRRSKYSSLKEHRAIRKKKSLVSMLYTSAAMIAAIICGVLLVLNYVQPFAEQPVATKKVEMREVSTEKGQRTTFRLSDGSRVTLNAESKIRIPSNFNSGNRELYLEGEAYFEVHSDKEHPFIVYSKDTFTRVLGTKFNIIAYEKDNRVLAAVEEGKVAFGSSDSTSERFEELTKNEVSELYEDGSSKVYYKENLDEYLGWKDGRLVFQEAPFKEVVDKLERWYNLKIIAPDTVINSRKLTASFKDEPMTEVLNVVAMTLHLEYKKDGRNVSFKVKEGLLTN